MQNMTPPPPPARSTALPADLGAWGLLASMTLLLTLAVPLLAGRDYLRDDLGAFHYPARAFYAAQLQRGEPFDWMPELYCGFYLTGEGQAGTYHPWHWLLYRTLPLHLAAGLEWISSYALMLPGMWLFLRRRLQRPEAAMFGALAFTFGSFNLLHFVHPNAVAVVAHLPWLLWAIDIVLRDVRRRRVAAAQTGIALLTGSQLLLGYPQYVWFSLLAEIAYVVYLVVVRPHEAREGCEQQLSCASCVGCTGVSWARVAIGIGVGLLIGGVQLLPTLDALAHSARRAADPSFAAWGSLYPLNLLQLVSPYYFTHRVMGENTHELGLYLGAAPLLLAVWALVRWRRLGRLGSLAWASAAFGAASLVTAFGQYGPLYRLQSWFPLIRSFRFPCRYTVLFALAAAVLAALGFLLLVDQCQQAAQHRKRTAISHTDSRFGTLWTLLAVAVAAAVSGLILQGHAMVAAPMAVLIGPALMAAAVTLFVLAAHGFRLALVGLVLLTAADLGVYGLSYAIYPPQGSLADYAAAQPKPPGSNQYRVVCDIARFDEPALRTGNALTLAGWQRADGYAGLEPRRPLDFRHCEALRAAGVRWVQRTPAAAHIEGLRSASTHWLEVPDPLPRVRLLDLDGTETSNGGTASLVASRPGHFAIDTDSPRAQRLVIAESYHPGWQATVDGEARAARCTGDGFLTVELGPGRHHVAIEFCPWSLRIGWFNTLLGLTLGGLWFVAGAAWPRRFAREVRR